MTEDRRRHRDVLAGRHPAGEAPERVAPDVWRIPLPLPFPPGSVNVYLLGEGERRTLIDSGLGLPADLAALEAGMAQAGATPERLEAIVLTHAHPDHIGLSGPLAERSGAPVYLLAGEDALLYRLWGAEGEATGEAITAMYRANGMPAEELADARAAGARLRSLLRLPERERIRTVRAGASITLGGVAHSILWTPGHADYHLGLVRADGLYLAGDHVLPAISPNIGLYPNARPNPLRDYYDALARVRDLPVRLVLPGHGRPFAELATRVDALRAGHEARSAALLSALAGSPDGAHGLELALRIFGARLRTPDDRRLALVETLAHLADLLAQGRVTRAEREGVSVYRLP